MSETFEQKAEAFLQAISKEQDMLIRYAFSLTKDEGRGHDLYADTLLKCQATIIANGFYGESFVAYMTTSIRNTFYKSTRKSKALLSLDETHAEIASEDCMNEQEHQVLVTGISSFIAAHFLPDEVAAFDLHVNGVSLEEIVFMSASFKNKYQVHRVLNRIKKAVRLHFQA